MLPRSRVTVVICAALVLLFAMPVQAVEDIRGEVKSLVKALRTRDNRKVIIQRRIAAAEMLGYIGDPSCLSDLSENLRTHPRSVGGAVAEACGRIGGPKALRILTSLLNNRYRLQAWDGTPLRQLGEAVGRMDHKNRNAYKLMLNRFTRGTRYSEGKPEPIMYYCMAWYGDQKSITAIINQMKTGRPSVQHLAAERLGEIGNRKGDEEMCMLVDYSEDIKLRRITAMSLGRRKATLAVESLLDALSAKLELEASQALGMIGDTEAIEDLKPLLKHGDAAVRLNAAFALARLGNNNGVNVAKAQLKSTNKQTAAKAAAMLVAAGDEAGPPKLKEVYSKFNAKERYWFIKDNLRGDKWAGPFLKQLAESEKYPGVKRYVKECVAELEKN